MAVAPPRIFLILCFSAGLLIQGNASGDPFADHLQAVFRESCVKCHGKDGKEKGGVNLLALKSTSDLTGDLDLVRDLIDVLDFEEMPPEDEPQPSSATREKLVATLETLLHETVAAEKSIPHTPVRRMNRFQYNNAVQDLFELNVEVFSLPERMCREYGDYFRPASGKMPDRLTAGSRPLGKSQLIEPRLAGVAAFPQDLRAEHGYDNRGDHLSLSPLLLEQFLRLSRSIVESHDFNPKTCGIWGEFFAPPESNREIETEIRSRLRKFLTQAFRRPVGDETLDRYVGYVSAEIAAGASFTESMKAAASAALASPRFFYLYNRAAGDEGVQPLDDFELASRLSFFLWGSLPDEELLDLAASGRLRETDILTRQVDRMLKDDRLKRFTDSFPPQWLQLDRIVSSVPNPDRHPDFYFAKYRASMDMMLEPLLLFEAILIEDRPVLELIDPDFSYRTARLRDWYGLKAKGKLGGPVTLEFRRVPVTDRRQGGVITNAAVMTMTSAPNRTQPITRGAWVATTIFNDPPDPPPADVPPLKEDDEDIEHLTLRERFAKHREQASCAGCHEKIDPLGFALENYDLAGKWRETYENGREVDPGGRLFRKHEFSSIVEFKDAILAEKDRFTRAFAGHLLAFALGREVAAADSPALDRIVGETKAADYRIQALIHEIVRSEPFLHKSNPKT